MNDPQLITGIVLLAIAAVCWIANAPVFDDDEIRTMNSELEARQRHGNRKKAARSSHSSPRKPVSIVHTARASESSQGQGARETEAVIDDGHDVTPKARSIIEGMAHKLFSRRGTSPRRFQCSLDSDHDRDAAL
jgi:hypothetical protein